VTDNTTHRTQWGASRFARLSPEQCKRLHEASLEILERTGVRLHESEAVELVRRAGGQVSDGNRVRIPARLVEQALAMTPQRVVLHDRAGEPVMPVDDHRTFYGPGSDCLTIIDHHTGDRRQPVLQDVADAATVCDALDNIDFVMSLFYPRDVPQAIADRYQMEVMLNSTTKPIIFVTYDLDGCVDAVEMAEAVAGGADALRQRPTAACYINVTTGFQHNAEALQKLLYLADKGLPALYIPVALGGLSAPVTVPGAMAIVNAGVLTGLVIAQLKREGSPVVIPGWGGSGLDMRTMVQPYAGPDRRGVAEALAHYYGLPMFSLGGASDAKLVDQQAAAEAALTLMVDALAGGNIIHDMGYLESGLTGSLVQLAICNEIVGWIKHFQREVEITDETLALDLIHEQGPDGQYLDTDHTFRHYRDRFYPPLFERHNYDDWLGRGGKTLAERAADQLDEILADHAVEPLPADVRQTVHAIVERAEERRV
jgi:trimethylamine--corrinoid protein Co-methyltransferase